MTVPSNETLPRDSVVPKNRLTAAIAAATAFLVLLAGLFKAYTEAVDAGRKATEAHRVAEQEPGAEKAYAVLAMQVEQLSKQVQQSHDDVIALRGFIEGVQQSSRAAATHNVDRKTSPSAGASAGASAARPQPLPQPSATPTAPKLSPRPPDVKLPEYRQIKPNAVLKE